MYIAQNKRSFTVFNKTHNEFDQANQENHIEKLIS